MVMKQFLLILMIIVLGYSASRPIQAVNPQIQTGIKSLIVSEGVFKESQIKTNNSQTTILYYMNKFEKIHANLPKVLCGQSFINLGILSYQFDSLYFTNGGYLLDTIALSMNQNEFMIVISHPKDNTAWLVYLDVMYIVVDINKNKQFVVFQRIAKNILLVGESSYIQYSSFLKTIEDSLQLIYMSAISGCQFKNSSIDLSITLQYHNSTHFSYLLSSHNQYSFLQYISFSIICIDKSISEPVYKYYQMIQTGLPNNQQHLFGYSNPVKNQYFIGFSQCVFLNDQKYGFKMNIDSLGISISQQSKYDRLLIYLFYATITKCQNGFYYAPNNDSCVSRCPSPIFQNRYCFVCIDYCQQCIDNTTCKVCIDTREITPDGLQCPCITGYQGVQGIEKCLLCSTITLGCLTCDFSSNTCNSCDTNLYFEENVLNEVCTCQPNRKLKQDNSSCVCINHYYDNEGICQMCHASCKQCESDGRSGCTQCDQQIFRFQSGTQCLCKSVEFIQLCIETTTTCNASVCYFNPQIKLQIQVLDIIKNPDKNSLIFTISLLPHINLLNQLNLTKLLSFGLPISSVDSFKYEDGIITTEISYNQNIHRRNTQLKLNFSQHGPVSFTKAPIVSTNYLVLPSNNLSAQYFDSIDYWITKYLAYMIYGLLSFSLVVFCIGMISSKIAVSQMVGVIQLSYLGLFMLDQNSPMMIPMAKLRYSFGYNDILPVSYGNMPIKIQEKGYTELVLTNLNISALLLIIPIILSLVFLILAKTRRQNKNSNLSLSKLFIGQWMMVVVLFILYDLTASTTIFALNSTTRDWKFTVSIVEIVLSFSIVLIISLMYILSDYNYFGEFKYMFKWKTFQLNYYLLQIVIRITSGILLGVLHYHFSTGIVIMCMFLLLSLITAIKNPFADKYHTIRSSIVTFIGALIIGLYTLVVMSGSAGFQSKVPLIVFILLFLVVCMTLFFVLRQYIKSKKIQKQYQQPGLLLEKESKQQQQFMKKQIQQAMKQGAHNSFARKLYIQKNKKLRKKKKPLIQQLIQDNVEIKQPLQQQQTKKKKKKKQHHSVTHPTNKINNEVNLQNGQYLNQSGPNISTSNNLNESNDNKWPQLTVERFHMVDQMLKDGLI